MFARVTQLEIDTLRIDVATAIAQYEQDILPLLKQQPGYGGILMLSNDQGLGVVVTLWETEDAADVRKTSGFYSDVLARFTTIFRTPPGRESYEVSLVDFPPGSPLAEMPGAQATTSPDGPAA